jgi:hypothetical protein
LNAQRLSRIAAGIAIVTALGVAGLVTRNVLWPEDPDTSLHSAGGKMLGDMAGYVGRVDREARTVDVSTSPLGIRPVSMVVTSETAIVVNGKQGAIGDLWKDLPVRVSYEVRDNTRYATSIQVNAGDAAASPSGKDPAPAAPAVAAPAPTRTAPAVTPAPSAPIAVTAPPAAPSSVAPATPAPTRPIAPAATAATPPRPATSAPVASKPAPPPPAVTTPAVPVVPAAARVVEPTPAPPRAAAPATESASVGSSGAASSGGRPVPAEAEADGSAAIDWLLKGTGRR